MRREDIPKYKLLCDKMRGLPRSLRAALGDSSIGCQLFVPYGVFIGQEAEISEKSWTKLRKANYGEEAAKISGWEKWEVFSDSTGCLRYIGEGNRAVLEEAKKVLADGDKFLDEFEELCVPEGAAWNLPNIWLCFGACRLPDFHSLLELICRQVGHEGDGRDIILEEAGLPIVDDTDKEFVGPPPRLQRFGLKMFEVLDLAAAASEAIEAWIPEDIDARIDSLAPVSPPPVDQPSIPIWNDHTLMFLGKVIKRFTRRAENQKIVLWAFQRAGWPEGIKDPLPPVAGLNRLHRRKRVRDTVAALNDDHRTRGLIHFDADGDEGIRWTRVG